jgi:hypothetical protein
MKRKVAATLLFMLIASWFPLDISLRSGQWERNLNWTLMVSAVIAIIAMEIAKRAGKHWFVVGLGVATLLPPIRILVQFSFSSGQGNINHSLLVFGSWGILGVLGWCAMAMILRRTMEHGVST